MLKNEDIQSMTTYIQESSEIITAFQEKVASLEKELAVKDTEINKQASEAVTLSPEQVEKTVEGLAQAGFLKKAEREDAQKAIVEDPAFMLTILDKVAEYETDRQNEVTPMGKTVQKEASSNPDERNSDKVFEETFTRIGRKL